MVQDISAINQRLLANLRRDDFSGYDVFDGLNARALQMTGLDRFAPVRLAWIQFFKRCPVNIRRLAGVPKKRNPKGIALVVMGMVEDFQRTGDLSLLDEAEHLGAWLLENRCPPDRWPHYCWGYPFPWQARAFYVPLGKPNIITTCYAARALVTLHRHTRRTDRFLEASLEAARFIVENLYTENDGRCFFAYIPGERTFIHNASLWGAAVVAELGFLAKDERMKALAHEVCMQSIREQMPDGGWVYGSRGHHRFIDGFHTGFNLEALHSARLALGTGDFDSAIEKGLAYYRRNFFLGDGTPKYYCNRIHPIDMHLVSQAVLTCLKAGGTEEDKSLCDKVVAWAIDNMYVERTGNFRYQITRWYKNNIPYMRWTQAWSYYSLAYYLNSKDGEEQCKKSSCSG